MHGLGCTLEDDCSCSCMLGALPSTLVDIMKCICRYDSDTWRSSSPTGWSSFVVVLIVVVAIVVAFCMYLFRSCSVMLCPFHGFWTKIICTWSCIVLLWSSQSILEYTRIALNTNSVFSSLLRYIVTLYSSTVITRVWLICCDEFKKIPDRPTTRTNNNRSVRCLLKEDCEICDVNRKKVLVEKGVPNHLFTLPSLASS